MKTYFDNQQMTKGEQAQQVKERAAFIRDVARAEADKGVTISGENDILFRKNGGIKNGDLS
jgi:hypothetical protein